MESSMTEKKETEKGNISQSGIDENLPDELCRRANLVYAATGLRLSLLHHLAYRLRANATEILQLRAKVAELEKTAK